MTQKIQIIIEDFDPEEKIVEGTMINKYQVSKRFREKGLKVEEFKKLIRKKFGDDVDIVNKVKKNRDLPFSERIIPSSADRGRNDDINTKDIIELMKNKYSD